MKTISYLLVIVWVWSGFYVIADLLSGIDIAVNLFFLVLAGLQVYYNLMTARE